MPDRTPPSGIPSIRGTALLPAILFAAGCLLLPSPGRAAEIRVLSMGEALAIAERANFQLQAEAEAIDEARSLVRRSKAPFYPTLELNAAETRTQPTFVGQGFDFPDPPPQNRFDITLDSRISALQPGTFSSLKLSRIDLGSAEIGYEVAVQSLLAATVQSYLALVRDEARMEVIDANIERDKVLLELAENQFDAGVATRIDVTRAAVRLASDRKTRLEQETQVLRSELGLKAILALPFLAPIEVIEPQPVLPRELAQPRHDLSALFEQRPDYRAQQQLLTRNEYAYKAARLDRLPGVDLFAQWGYASEEPFDGLSRERWRAGIAFNLPIFEGFRIQASETGARSRIRQTRNRLRDLELRIEANYLVARKNVESRFEQIKISRRQVELAEEELELAQTRFTEGVADNRDVVDAQANLALASDDLVNTIYLFELSRLELAQVKGDVRLVLVQ